MHLKHALSRFSGRILLVLQLLRLSRSSKVSRVWTFQKGPLFQKIFFLTPNCVPVPVYWGLQKGLLRTFWEPGGVLGSPLGLVSVDPAHKNPQNLPESLLRGLCVQGAWKCLFEWVSAPDSLDKIHVCGCFSLLTNPDFEQAIRKEKALHVSKGLVARRGFSALRARVPYQDYGRGGWVKGRSRHDQNRHARRNRQTATVAPLCCILQDKQMEGKVLSRTANWTCLARPCRKWPGGSAKRCLGWGPCSSIGMIGFSPNVSLKQSEPSVTRTLVSFGKIAIHQWSSLISFVLRQSPEGKHPDDQPTGHYTLTKYTFMTYHSLRPLTCTLPVLSGPVRDTPPYRAIPFQDSIAEGGIAPICLVFIGYRASIAEIPFLKGVSHLHFGCSQGGKRSEKGQGYRTQLAMLRHQKPHSAQ